MSDFPQTRAESLCICRVWVVRLRLGEGEVIVSGAATTRRISQGVVVSSGLSSPHDPALRRLLALPWTIVPETTPEGDRLLRVREIPSAVGHGATDAELERDLWDSLRESLLAYLHFGDAVPQPHPVAPTILSVVAA